MIVVIKIGVFVCSVHTILVLPLDTKPITICLSQVIIDYRSISGKILSHAKVARLSVFLKFTSSILAFYFIVYESGTV